MDIVIFIIAMLVFYVLPEILKRRRKTEYKYPEIPERVPPPPAKVPPTVPDSGDKRLPPSAIPDLAQVNKPVAAKETPPCCNIRPGPSAVSRCGAGRFATRNRPAGKTDWIPRQ